MTDEGVTAADLLGEDDEEDQQQSPALAATVAAPANQSIAHVTSILSRFEEPEDRHEASKLQRRSVMKGLR